MSKRSNHIKLVIALLAIIAIAVCLPRLLNQANLKDLATPSTSGATNSMTAPASATASGQVPPVHRACTDAGVCAIVPGADADSCTNDDECVRRICGLAGGCLDFPGDPASSNCKKDGDCPMVCFRGACMLSIPGITDGGPPCTSQSECSHRECQTDDNGHSFCLSQPAPGVDSCHGHGDCARYTRCMSGLCRVVTFPWSHDCNTNEQCSHLKCTAEGYCQYDPHPGQDECRNTSDCGHNECDNSGRCVHRLGAGSDDCQTDMNCSHTQCSSGRCVIAPGAGANLCTTHADCGPTHRVCQLTPGDFHGPDQFCAIVPGVGQDECTDDRGCSHRACHDVSCRIMFGQGPDTCSQDRQCYHFGCYGWEGYCTRLPGGREDTCTTNAECGRMVCSPNNDCVRMSGVGPDECQLPFQCGPSHLTCEDEKCRRVAGAGNDTCYHSLHCRHPELFNSIAGTIGQPASVAGGVMAQPLAPERIQQLLAESSGPHLGLSSAPVKIVMFQDLSCGMCAAAYRQIVTILESSAIKEGVASFETREFPLGGRMQERISAELALCANEQGKYWEAVSWILDHAHDKGILIDASTLAQALGLNKKALESCANSHRHSSTVQKGIDLGTTLGVDGTPTFFINGVIIRGVRTIDEFQAVIKAAMPNRSTAVQSASESAPASQQDSVP